MGLCDIFKKTTKKKNSIEFPFYDAPNTATFTCCHVMENNEPIVYVSHDEDDGRGSFYVERSMKKMKRELSHYILFI